MNRRTPRTPDGIDRNIAKFDDSKRGLAKLMARENISVQFLDNLPTASFDVVGRVLSLPNWPNISIDQLDLLIGHEVSHALNTDATFIERIFKGKTGRPRLMGYFNVVEDARIEKKIRASYPGMNSVFYNGYGDFVKNGPFFKAIDRNTILQDGAPVKIASMNLIDRINLHYKIGAFVDVPFKAHEIPWLQKIDRCYSTENAVEIAEGLYKLAKETEQEQPKQPQQQSGKGKPQPSQGDESESDESESDDAEGSEGDGDSKPSKGKDKKDGKSEGKGKGGKKGDDKKSEPKDKTDGKSANHDKDGDGDSGDDESEEGDGDSTGDADDESDESDADAGETDGSESGDAGDDDASDPSDDASDDEAESDGDATNINNPRASAKKGKGVEPSAASTDEAVNKALQKLVEQNQNDPAATIKHLLIAPLTEDETRKRTVSAADWSERTSHKLERVVAKGDLETALLKIETLWSRRYMPLANHMAAEFQRRKMAKRLQHARIGRTGKLDVNRLHSYQIADDLFKRTMIVPNGQSHGIVVMIDGSSSMNGVFGSVLDQVLLFAQFAFKCNIPFEAYMFSDKTETPDRSLDMPNMGTQVIVPPANGRLIGLVNTSTDRASFKKQVRMVLAARSHFSGALGTAIGTVPPYMSLNGTPLYAGMMVMERQVARMKRTKKLDKVMALVISDGGDTNGVHYTANDVQMGTAQIYTRTNIVGHGAFVARDTVTKKNHTFVVDASTGYGNRTMYSAPQNAVLTLLFDVMKERHDCRGIMMFLISGRGYGVDGAESIIRRAGEERIVTNKEIANQLDANGLYVVPNSAADLGLVVLTDTFQLNEDTFAKVNTSGKSGEQIGKAFIDSQKQAAANRVFVNTLMPYLI